MKKKYWFVPSGNLKVQTRRNHLRSYCNVAYKDDGDSLKQALETIDKKLTEFKAATSKEAQDKAVAEVKALMEGSNADWAAQWEKKHNELTDKNATIKQLLDEQKEMKAKMGRQKIAFPMGERKGLIQIISDTIVEKKAEIAKTASGGLIETIDLSKKMTEQKAAGVITDSNFTGTNAPYRGYLDWQPGMEPTGQFRFRSLVRTIDSDLDNVSFPRAATPIGEGSFGRQVLQTDTKAQVDRDYAMIDVLCKVKAGFAIVSRRSLVNIRFLQSWLPTSMMEQLEDTEDADFANAVVAAAAGSASTTGITSTGSTLIVTLVAIIKNLIQAKFTPGTIVADPNVWANAILNVESNAGFNLPNVVTVDAAGNTRVLGRIIQPVNWLTGNRVLCADWSRLAIVQSEGLTMRQSDSHDQIFAKNQLAFLLERVEEVAVFRPDAVTSTVIP